MGGRGAISSIGLGSGAGKPNDATEYYVSGDGMYINNALRDGRELDAEEKQLIKDLDLATSGSVKQDDLYRSVDAKAIFGNMDWQDYDNLVQYLGYGANSFDKGAYSQNQLAKAKNLINKAQGKTVTEKGYMSTTKDESIASDWGGFSGSEMPVVMHLKNTKGAKHSVGISGGKGETLIHNHPSGSNFSDADLKNFATTQIKSIVATSSNKDTKGTYQISKGNKFDAKGFIKALSNAKWDTNKYSYNTGADWWLKKNQKKYGYTYTSKGVKGAGKGENGW